MPSDENDSVDARPHAHDDAVAHDHGDGPHVHGHVRHDGDPPPSHERRISLLISMPSAHGMRGGGNRRDEAFSIRVPTAGYRPLDRSSRR